MAIIGVVRIWGLIELFYFPDPNADTFYDIKMVLSVVEVNTAIVTACAPALRPLLRHMFPSLFAMSSADDYDPKSPGHGTGPGGGGGGGSSNHKLPYGQGSRNFSKKTYGGDVTRTRSQHHHHHHPHHPNRTTIAMKPLRGYDSPHHSGHIEVRGSTPTGSDEAIMTYDGIMRTMDVKVQYEDTEPLQRTKTVNVEGRPSRCFD